MALFIVDALLASFLAKALLILVVGGVVNLCLWRRQAWAHFLATVLAALGSILALLAIITVLGGGKGLNWIGCALFLALSLVEIWSFWVLNRRDVRVWCNRKV